LSFKRFASPCRTVRRALSARTAVGILALALSCTALPCGAQQKPRPVPDVVVMVLSGAMPSDTVSFTYKGVVGDAAARADLQSLLNRAGWIAKETRITSGSAQPKMTSVEFQVDGAVNWRSGALLVEPFVVAFRRFDALQINYLLQGTFPFRSLRNYSDRYIQTDWTSVNNTESYTITIKDHNFDRLNLPLVVEPPGSPKTESVERPSQGGRKTWLALVLALAAGAVVFVVVSRISRR